MTAVIPGLPVKRANQLEDAALEHERQRLIEAVIALELLGLLRAWESERVLDGLGATALSNFKAVANLNH